MARDTVQEIKVRLSIMDVVGQYVKLRKAGRSYVGLCPFHKEKTPSFHVSLERGSWHCFGCGEGGDMFTFIEKVEGVDFKGALRTLAEKAGVQVEYNPRAGESRSRQERLHEAMDRAAQFYVGKLEGSEAYKYALSRGLTSATIKEWQLGYAPDDWRQLLEYLSAQGFSTDEMLSAGLIKEADGKRGTYYDRFRNRLMFPIRDGNGRVAAFTGRALAKDEPAKYLNSPETDLYHKSDILFGLDKAKESIRARGFSLLVEGQMDLLHAHQAGFANAVALSGTALTERHVALLKRYAANLMLVLDADAAGLTASAKAAQLALRQGLKVKAVRLPAGEDPADVISRDPKEFARRVAEGKQVIEFFLSIISEREKDPHRVVLAAERVVLPLLRAIESPLEREHFIGATARALGLSSEAVKESVKRLPSDQVREALKAPTPSNNSDEKRPRETVLIALIKAYPDSALAKRVENEYIRIVGVPPAVEAPEEAIFEAERLLGEAPAETAADDLIRAFEEASIREAYQEAIGELRRAENKGDAQAVEKAQAACAAISARLALLH